MRRLCPKLEVQNNLFILILNLKNRATLDPLVLASELIIDIFLILLHELGHCLLADGGLMDLEDANASRDGLLRLGHLLALCPTILTHRRELGTPIRREEVGDGIQL